MDKNLIIPIMSGAVISDGVMNRRTPENSAFSCLNVVNCCRNWFLINTRNIFSQC